MKKTCSFVSFLLILLLAFPCVASTESPMDEYTQIIENCLVEGMTIEEIAVFSHQASAEVLSGYSDNYLKVLIAIMQLELRSRGNVQGEVVVPMGEYVVGVDIPAGTYTVTAGQRYCSLEIYTNGKLVHDFDMHSGGSVGKVTLKTNQVVCVEYDSMTFAPYKGLGF